MASLSHEDLDAGWDDLDEAAAAAPQSESTAAGPQASAPPKSLTIEKTPAQAESVDSNPEGAAEALAAPEESDTLPESLPSSSPPPVNPAEALAAPEEPDSLPESLRSTSHPRVSPAETRSEDASRSSEPFVPVTEKPKLLAYQGVETPIENDASPVQVVAPAITDQARSIDQDEAAASSAKGVRAEKAVRAVSASPQAKLEVSSDVAFEQELEVEIASGPQSSAMSAIRQRRFMVIAAGALLCLILCTLLAIRVKHSDRKLDQAPVSAKLGPIQAERAAPLAVTNPALPSAGASVTGTIPVPAEIGPPESAAHARPAVNASPASESFSDAFVKHAAAVNSNWAEVKKHTRATDTAQVNRPAAAGAGTAKANDNPLDLLDKLEKARKAKKQSPSKPE